MLPAAIVRALTTPFFEPHQFIATQWNSAEDKAKFANALMTFIANEFPRRSFTKSLYQRLSNTFGHIAHYAEGAVMRSNRPMTSGAGPVSDRNPTASRSLRRQSATCPLPC